MVYWVGLSAKKLQRVTEEERRLIVNANEMNCLCDKILVIFIIILI